MQKILAAFHLDDPASLKRLLVTVLGGGLLLLAPVLSSHGIPVPSDAVLETVAGLLAVFVLQSGAKSAVIAHAEIVAATPTPTPADAEASLRAAIVEGAK